MEATIHRADGSVSVIRKDNMIVDVGFDFIADAIGRASGRPAPMSHIAIGESTTPVSANQTNLLYASVSRVATYEHVEGSKTFRISATFGPGEGTGAITEAGVFNAGSGGTMLDRVVFNVINKGEDDTLTVVFTFNMS